MNFSKINELKPYDLNCNIFDVYSYDGLSMQELLCQFFTKINECIKTSNETIELAEWLVNEGLKQEVAIKLSNWLNDGTLENIINVTLFENLNNKIDNVSSQLEHVEKVVKHLTPELFGGKGDGVTDDYQAFVDMFEYMNNNANNINIGGTQLLKDFGEFNILFNGKYAISNTLYIPSCYNLKLNGLYLTSTDNFNGDFLLKSEGIFRNSHFDNCIFDGNNWKASCLLIESSSLANRISNCQFRRFKYYGLKAGENKGHELIISNSKFNQYEWRDKDEYTMPATQGIGIYLSNSRHDNHISNCVISYCLGSGLKIEGSSNFINNTHFYTESNEGVYGVELIGTHNYCNNCFFDGTTVLLGGLNDIKNSFFMSSVDMNFIILNETDDTKWKYNYSSIIGNIFKGNVDKITEPIKALNLSIDKSLINIYDNNFINSNTKVGLTNKAYNPTPFTTTVESLSSSGYLEIGNIKYIWGYATCGTAKVLDCSKVLNVQLTSAQQNANAPYNNYVTGITGNQFTPQGHGSVYFFATCVK